MRRKVILGALVLLPLGFCAFANLVNAPDKSARDADNRAAGDRIIVALQQYRAQHGRYPEMLAALAPAHMASIPEAAGGKPFAYEARSDGAAFTLLYAEAPLGMLPSDGFYVYDSERAVWRLEVR